MNKDLLEIRKVKPEDAKNWIILVNKVWRDAYKNIFPEEVFIDREKTLEEKVNNFSNKIKNDNKNIAYVAEYKGKLIGIMCGNIKSHYNHFGEYADLTALYINPKFQGCSIGTKFKNIFEQWAIQNGKAKYVIGVLKDNDKARNVYKSWGGKLSEFEENFVKLGIGYTEVFYTYDLQKKLNKYEGSD